MPRPVPQDPHLGFRLTAAYVKGVQEPGVERLFTPRVSRRSAETLEQGVMAVAKHFAFNEHD